jgi:hypothetical protein
MSRDIKQIIRQDDYYERQANSKEEFDRIRLKDIEKHKKEAHKFIDDLDSSFVIIAADPQTSGPTELPMKTQVLNAVAGNQDDFRAIVASLYLIPPRSY